MILDNFKLRSLVFQVQYPNAFEIWDHAGAIGRRLCSIWPGMDVVSGEPAKQTFVAPGVNIQIGIETSTITLLGTKLFDESKIGQLKQSFEVCRELLTLRICQRISTRIVYAKDFQSLGQANAALFAMDLAAWPKVRVFDQSLESQKNGLEIAYRFEDAGSFSVLRLKAEEVRKDVELDPEYFDEPKMSGTRRRLLIDFDRGMIGSVDAEKFRPDEWLKGFQHVLRRDIEKVLKASS